MKTVIIVAVSVVVVAAIALAIVFAIKKGKGRISGILQNKVKELNEDTKDYTYSFIISSGSQSRKIQVRNKEEFDSLEVGLRGTFIVDQSGLMINFVE